MRFDTIALEPAHPVAEIRLNRPEQGNPVDAAFLQELDAAAAVLRDDPAVRAVLLTASGDVFSAAATGVGAGCAFTGLPFRGLELLPQPVIACIEGDALDAGLELALACDLRIAADGATFALRAVARGSMPSAGGTQRLPRLIGRARAAEMILLGRGVDAAMAADWGLVNHVAPRAEVRAIGERIAARIVEQGPLAVRYAKEAIIRGLDMPLDQALRYETDLTVILQSTDDRAEGVRAFIEKRPPRFEGR